MTDEQINKWGVFDALREAQALCGAGSMEGAGQKVLSGLEFLDGVEGPKAISMANALQRVAQGLSGNAPSGVQALDELASEVQNQVPDFRIVLLDDTSDWAESISSQTGKIFAAYLYDARRATYLAELQPSYELHYLYTTGTNVGVPEDVEEALQVNGGPEDGAMYMHVRVVDAMPWDRKSVCTEPSDTRAESYDALVEGEVESYRCSVDIQLPRQLGAQEAAYYAQRLIERGAVDEANALVDAMPRQEREVVLGATNGQRDGEDLTKGLDVLLKLLDAQRILATAAHAVESRAEKASKFISEVLAEYESLQLLAEHFGTSTLADVTHVMASIVQGTNFEVWPSQTTGSRIDEVVSGLPSSEEWLANLKFMNKYGDQVPHSVFKQEAPETGAAPSI